MSTPKTGNGTTGGDKPKPQDCAQRLKNGTKMIKQPDKKWARKPAKVMRREDYPPMFRGNR